MVRPALVGKRRRRIVLVRCVRWRSLTLVSVVLWALVAAGCSDASTDETPAGAVRLFLDAMDRSEREPDALREAYALLASPSRRALLERAHLAGSLGGRHFDPWEMLVRGRARRTFSVREGTSGMRASIHGDEATVTVSEDDGERRATIPLVLENGRWRLVVDIPPAR